MRENGRIRFMTLIFFIFTLTVSVGIEKNTGFFSERVKTIQRVVEKEGKQKEEEKQKEYIYSTGDGEWMELGKNTWVMDVDKNPENGYEIILTYDGNDWLYEFSVEDSNRDYHVYEEIIKEDLKGRYTSKGSDGNDADINQMGTVPKEETENGVIYTITNKKNDYEVGNLKIVKKVIADSEKQKDNRFLFKIKLTGENISGIQSFGDLAFKDGIASIYLGNDENVVLNDIPVGTKYEVKEEELGYGWKGKIKEGGSEGSITADSREIVFENTYKEPPILPSEMLGGFKVLKKVLGTEAKDQDYEFMISLSNLEKGKEYTYKIGNKTKMFKGESADISLRLKKGEVVEFSNLPIGTKYQIMEKGGKYESSYSITKYIEVENSNDVNLVEGKDLVTSVENVESAENAEIVFVNKLFNTQNLKIEKIIKDSDSTNEVFIINLKLFGLVPNHKYDSDFGVIIADEDGEYECDINISNKDVFEIRKLPVGSSYKFKEVANPYQASFKITASEGNIINEEGENDIQNKDLETAREVIDVDEDATVTFINKKPKEYAKIKLVKYEFGEEKKKIGPARYNLYMDNSEKGIEDELIQEVQIHTNGESDTIEKINPGKYYVIETQAPPGYALNPIRKEFEITKDHLETKVIEVDVYDDKVVLPQTGGRGFSILPIIGVGILGIAFYSYKKRGKEDEKN